MLLASALPGPRTGIPGSSRSRRVDDSSPEGGTMHHDLEQPPRRARRHAWALASGFLLALGLGGAALTSGTAGAASQAAPTNTAEPRISGAPVVGATLNATRGEWSGSTPMTFAFQWVRCPES